MRRELVGAGLATAVLVAGVFAGSAATAQTAGQDGSTPGVSAAGKVKDREAVRERTAELAPQEVITEDGVNRVFGENRYATAAAIAEAYGWTGENTIAVYVASGLGYADALAAGPSMLGDGPLLLVKPGSIPPETDQALKALQPCYIDVMGGTVSVSDAVFESLKKYVHPEFCAGQ